MSHLELINMEGIMRWDLQFIVPIREDLNVEPYVDVTAKVALSPQLF